MLGHKGHKAVCIAVLENKEPAALIARANGYHRLVRAEKCAVFVLDIKIFSEIHSLVYLRVCAECGIYLDLRLLLPVRREPYVDAVRLDALIKHLGVECALERIGSVVDVIVADRKGRNVHFLCGGGVCKECALCCPVVVGPVVNVAVLVGAHHGIHVNGHCAAVKH